MRKTQMPGGEAVDPVENKIDDSTPELPEMADVDVTTLTRAVLTRQGWLCPNPKEEA